MLLDVFFFQAEDGIRYLVRSRGLGDVYKRQVLEPIALSAARQRATAADLEVIRQHLDELEATAAVSYTHLTLPTSDLV